MAFSLPGAQTSLPVLLLIAGSDPTGGAGVQQDLKIATLLETHGLTVVTALTVQSGQGVEQVQPVAPEVVQAQLKALLGAVRPTAIKIGMLATAAIVEVVAEALAHLPSDISVVLDPVLAASDGTPLLDAPGAQALIARLLPRTTVLTPNLPEAARLTGLPVVNLEDMTVAARRLAALGPQAVLLKGGHLAGEPVDLLFDGKNCYQLPGVRSANPHTHGTGCALATALAAGLAHGRSLPEAVHQARELVAEAIRYGLPLGPGRGPINPLARFQRELDRHPVLEQLKAAARRLQEADLSPLIPEVQSNLGYATRYPRGPEDVAAFPGRILKTPRGILIPQAPEFGASRHIASIILTVMQVHPEHRAALNLRYLPEIQALADLLHFRVASFDRRQEPAAIKAREGSTLAWGVASVLSPDEPPPDIIFDEGDWGKEPMLRLLGRDPLEVVGKALALQQALRASGNL